MNDPVDVSISNTPASTHTDHTELPRAYDVILHGEIRRNAEDFQVDEDLGFAPSGEGEHVLLHIRKRGMTTPEVARLLARHAGVPPREVSYAGLKDRHAVTSQWFSVTLSGKAMPDWASLDGERLTVLTAQRHQRKLRRGALMCNRFAIIVRDVQGDLTLVPERLHKIGLHGVPNYFGDQRFGYDNVARARSLLAGEVRVKDRTERGIYLSALRSYLFNMVLARRVIEGSWCELLSGEVVMLDGSRSFFVAETVDDVLQRRLTEHDVHPSGPLCGRGELQSKNELRTLEESVLARFAQDRTALAAEGLVMERRCLRLIPRNVQFEHCGGNVIRVSFDLPPGTYATVVIRELATGLL